MKQYATSFLLVLVLYAPAILGSPDSIGANVEVLGLSQDRAFVRINGQQHVMRAGGKSQSGVTLVSASAHQAVVSYQGREYTLGLSQRIGTRYRSNAAPKPASGPVVVQRNPRGQFIAQGSINGAARPLLVDTGASLVAMSAREARSLGINFEGSRPLEGRSASGAMTYYEVVLDSIKVAHLTVRNVKAAVIEGEHPETILLGMSFLEHVALQQQGTQLRLSALEDIDTPIAAR